MGGHPFHWHLSTLQQHHWGQAWVSHVTCSLWLIDQHELELQSHAPQLSTLLYADDIGLLSRSSSGLQHLLYVLQLFCAEKLLFVNQDTGCQSELLFAILTQIPLCMHSNHYKLLFSTSISGLFSTRRDISKRLCLNWPQLVKGLLLPCNIVAQIWVYMTLACVVPCFHHSFNLCCRMGVRFGD